jgi:hypothetical protein
VFHTRFSRFLASALLVGSGALATVGTATSASALDPTGIRCKVLTGNIATTVTLKKCNGNTGGASQAMTATSLATGGTINWVNGKSTTVKLTVAEGDSTTCPVNNTRYNAKGKVTADTTGSTTVGAKVKAAVCVDNGTGAIMLVPDTKAVIKPAP